MVLFEDINVFQAAARDLVFKKPGAARATLKYRPNKKQAVLKVTDDLQVLRFKTSKQVEIRIVLKTLQLLMKWMASTSSEGDKDYEYIEPPTKKKQKKNEKENVLHSA